MTKDDGIYHADYSKFREKWCVWEQLTAQVRTVYKVCESQEEAEELASKLNGEGEAGSWD